MRDYRKDFPIIKNNKNLSYLDNAATTQRPLVVINALKEFYEKYNANVHRGIYRISEIATEKLESSRKVFAEFINASPEEIIFTRNATEGFNNIANSIERGFGKKLFSKANIVVTEIEHHSNFVPWQQLALRTGSEFRIAKYIRSDDTVQDIAKHVDKNTSVVAFTLMSNVSGKIFDGKNIIQHIRRKNPNVIIVVDATQYVAHRQLDVKSLGADFVCFSAHKVYGTFGVGIVYGKRNLLEKISPFNFGGHMISEVHNTHSTWAELPDKFESGTIDSAGIIASAVGINYFKKIGYSNIERIEKQLLNYALLRLRLVPSVKIIGHDSSEHSEYGSVISFIVNGIHPHDLATICDNNNICIRAGHHCAQPFMKALDVVATSRISLSYYNNKKDIDNLIKAIHEAEKIFH